MDLSFRLPDPAATSELPAADMALLVAMLAERQAASATAQVQATLCVAPAAGEEPLAPAHGAFNIVMATRITEWKHA